MNIVSFGGGTNSAALLIGLLSRLCGKDTPQTESGKREKQAFTDKNNYIASTANEYPFARNARAALWEARAFCLLG